MNGEEFTTFEFPILPCPSVHFIYHTLMPGKWVIAFLISSAPHRLREPPKDLYVSAVLPARIKVCCQSAIAIAANESKGVVLD